jgi:hypothetical protein
MVALITIAVPSTASAASPSACQAEHGSAPKTVIIDGREYGPKDGVEVDTFSCELEPGSGSVGIVFDGTQQSPGQVSPMITWGASYAISTEWWSQLGYDGRAKAAANLYSGKRIVQVCIWYTREGDGVVGAKVCSNASSPSGTWLPGPEVTTSAADSLNPFAPHTVFNFSTVRIGSGV